MNKLGTSRYANFAPWMGVPIQISVTAPKWMPGLDYITPLKPTGLLKIHNEMEFTGLYRDRLDKRADEIKARLIELSQKYPGLRLVMLCWDDIADGRDWCHRRTAAAWLEEHDLDVPEMPKYAHQLDDRRPLF